MKFTFLASLIVFIILIAYENKKHSKMAKKMELSFWERERLANNTRRKPLDNLEYISIPFDTLPMAILPENPEIMECHGTLHDLKDLKIVNLTGFTNTDLKLTYGTANITCLTDYDQSYTLLARTLQKWAELLLEQGYEPEARTVLEFAVSTRTDISKSYYALADIYFRRGESFRIKHLLETAQELNSVMNGTIVRTLQEAYPCTD